MDYLKETSQYLIDFINATLAEAAIVTLFLGLIFFIIGIIILIVSLHIWLTGQRVEGEIIGAIKQTRIKEKIINGKIEKKVKETLYPIFEYKRKDGSLYQEQGSSGGNAVLKYSTGQIVKLIICPRKEFDDVYDASDSTPLIMGGIFTIIGFLIMVKAASFYASLGIGSMLSFIIIVSIIFKIITSNRKKKNSNPNQHIKRFKLEEVKPIESFLKNI